MKKLSSLLLISIMTIIGFNAHAKLVISRIFGDNMVLQRNIKIPIWGWADVGEKVTITFAGKKQTATASKDGKWIIYLNPMKANKIPQTMTISGEDGNHVVVIKNILIGEVWLCSGQSNMQFPLVGVLNAQKEIKNAYYPQMRLIKIPHINTRVPQNQIRRRISWTVCTPGTVKYFSAVGYFFGKKLLKELDVPVGLISSNWGGTKIEPWIPPVGFRNVPELKRIADLIDSWNSTTSIGKKAYRKYINELKKWIREAENALNEGKKTPPIPQAPQPGENLQHPTKLYNGMIHPLIPYALRGAIWYQGEANGREGITYYYKMKALISGWRKLWNQGDFPFYYVQLPNNGYSDINNAAGGDGWARLRDAQLKALSIPHTGMAVTIDIGETGNIHPKNKQDVGKRLALWALAKDYGKNIVYSGPLYKSYKIENNKIRVFFTNTGSGLIVGKKKGLNPVVEDRKSPLKWFSIAGKDKKWYRAKAVIDGNTVVVSSDKVKNPVAVRYAYTMNPAGANLYNKEGLPASPFRTDNW